MVVRKNRTQSIPLGVVIRRLPGVTRWSKWSWKAVSVLPGAGEANWQVLRSEGDAVEYHAATVPLSLYRSDTEAYVHELNARVPSVYVVMRDSIDAADDIPYEILVATASPYEAQDYADSGEEIVEKVPMPPALLAWVRDFVDQHHEEEVFVKRRRDRVDMDREDDGIGDPRIPQLSDVYRSPHAKKREQMH